LGEVILQLLSLLVLLLRLPLLGKLRFSGAAVPPAELTDSTAGLLRSVRQVNVVVPCCGSEAVVLATTEVVDDIIFVATGVR
jgi:hypothetical protein